MAADAFQVHHVGAVEHGEMHRVVAGLEQVLQERQCRLAQLLLAGHVLAQLEQADAQLVAGRRLLHQAQHVERGQQAVQRGLR